MENVSQLLSHSKERMEKAIASLQAELAKVRVGRAHPSLLDHLSVDYYDTRVPLKQICSIRTEDAATLLLEVWEKPMAEAVAKAIAQSDLGLNPAVQGMIVRVTLPPMTQERRREVVRVVHRHGEASKVAVRNIRRDSNQQAKNALKEKSLSQDEEKDLHASVQKLTNFYIAKVSTMVAAKEKDLMSS